MDYEAIRQRISDLRSLSRKSLDKTGEKIGMSGPAFQKIEYGGTKLRLDHIEGLAKAFNVSESYIIFGSEQEHLAEISALKDSEMKEKEKVEGYVQQVKLFESALSNSNSAIEVYKEQNSYLNAQNRELEAEVAKLKEENRILREKVLE